MDAVKLDRLTLVEVTPEVLLGDVGGEFIALNMQTDNYLHLNSSGSFVFGCLHRDGAQSIDRLCEAAGQEYAVDEETCRKETAEFVSQCLELGLLRISDDEPLTQEV